MRFTPTLLLLLFCFISYSQSVSERPLLPVTNISSEIQADGMLDEAEWSLASEISDLTTVVPVQGGDASENTIVKILAHPKFNGSGLAF